MYCMVLIVLIENRKTEWWFKYKWQGYHTARLIPTIILGKRRVWAGNSKFEYKVSWLESWETRFCFFTFAITKPFYAVPYVVCLNSWSYRPGLLILDKCPREIIFVWFFDREHCISSWSEKHVVVFCSHINHSQLSFFLWNFHSSSQAFWGVAPINLKNFSGATPKSVSKSHVKQ